MEKCVICFNKMKEGKLQKIHNTLYHKLSQKLVTNRLHQGKPSHLKYNKISNLSCGHKFHYNCIKKWFKQNPSCPLCRN